MIFGRKTIALFIGALALSYLVVAIGTHVIVRTSLLPKLDAQNEQIARFDARIFADLKLLTAHPIFAESKREKNASTFLSGFIGWDGAEPLKTLEHDRLVALMKDHLEALKSEEAWSSLVDDDALDDLDLAWVDQLSAYDYIDFESHPAFTSALAEISKTHGVPRVGLISSLPLPNFLELRFAALARAAQLAISDHARDGLELYRHVSELMASSDSLGGSLTALTMLQNEKRLAEFADTKWELIDESRIDAFKRTIWVWTGIERFTTVDGSLGKYEPYFSRATGACSTMLDLPGTENILADYLRPTVFLEPNLNERLDRHQATISNVFETCGHSELKVVFSPIESPLRLGRVVFNPARVPFVRRFMGLGAAAMATPNYVRFYEQNPREPASN